MRSGRGWVLVGVVAGGVGLVPATASAQTASLGGYGALAEGAGAAMAGGGGSGMVAPFGGRLGAAMPSSLGGGGAAFRPRPVAGMGGTRAAFTVDPLGGGMAASGSARRPFGLPDLGPGGFSGRIGRGAMAPAGARSVLPPSLGSPFRPPTTLPALGGAGASM